MSWAEIFGVIKPWQTLIGSIVAVTAASLAAFVAWKNVGRQIRHSEELENQRRSRKQVALRSVLPLGLSAISDYAELTTRRLHELLIQCVDGRLPHQGVQSHEFPATPEDTISTLAEFIEFSDSLNTELFENLLSRIQILSARARQLVTDINSPRDDQIITTHWIEMNIIQAASVYAGAAQGYDYARRRSQSLPTDVTWDNVRQALRNMRLFDDVIPRVHETIERLAQQSKGPTLG